MREPCTPLLFLLIASGMALSLQVANLSIQDCNSYAENYLIYIDLLLEEEAGNPLSRMSGRDVIGLFRTIFTEP